MHDTWFAKFNNRTSTFLFHAKSSLLFDETFEQFGCCEDKIFRQNVSIESDIQVLIKQSWDKNLCD